MAPGLPTPTASRSARVATAPARDASIEQAMALMTSAAPERGVAARELPATRSPSITTVWILVPPRSTPATRLMARTS
jgi:hypothetical protein